MFIKPTRLLCLYRRNLSKLYSRSTSNLSQTPSHTPSYANTLHEESAGGLNGRLAKYSHSPTELLAFYSRLGPSDRSHLNLCSYNYILSALLLSGQQMEAFRLINHLESSLPGFPDKSTFAVLMRGLVEADTSGSLALAADECFQLMQQKFKIIADSELWSLRIRAFLHSKFLNPSDPSLEPARIFYHQMLTEMNTKDRLNLDSLRSDLVVTAVTRRLWTFAEWMLSELSVKSESTSDKSGDNNPYNTNNTTNVYTQSTYTDKIANASGLFLDTASLPILRAITSTKSSNAVSSFGFQRNLLLYCWRQGRIASDLALPTLKFLLKTAPTHAKWWLETAEGCLRRELPRDYYSFDADEAKERFLATVQRVKCPESAIKLLEQEIIHQKLIT